jgi:hypothetical protein
VTAHRALAALALAALVATRIDPRLLELPFVDRSAQARSLALYPDRQWPGYPRFLEGVRAHTRPGDTIAIIVPATRWDDGYSYAYYRASYFLTGREVLPVLDLHDVGHPENLSAARFIAAFGMAPTEPAQAVWSGEGGTLYRQ